MRSTRRLFGFHAFVECMLKLSLVHLGYHRTAAQAEQPASLKAMWLLVYMHVHFLKAKDRAVEVEKALRGASWG